MTTPAPRWVGWVLDWTEPEAEERGAKGNGGQGVGQPSDFAVRHSIERGGETHGDGGTLVWIELGPTIRRSPSPRHKTGRRGSWEWRDVSGGFRRAQWPLSPLRDGTKAEGRLAYLGWVKKEVVKKSKMNGYNASARKAYVKREKGAPPMSRGIYTLLERDDINNKGS
jgi:hypothetical protein